MVEKQRERVFSMLFSSHSTLRRIALYLKNGKSKTNMSVDVDIDVDVDVAVMARFIYKFKS